MQVKEHLAEQHQKQNAKPESEAPVSPSSATGGSPSAGPSPKETITEFSLSNTNGSPFSPKPKPNKKIQKHTHGKGFVFLFHRFTSFFSPKKNTPKSTQPRQHLRHENRTRGRTGVRRDATSAAWLPSSDIPSPTTWIEVVVVFQNGFCIG